MPSDSVVQTDYFAPFLRATTSVFTTLLGAQCRPLTVQQFAGDVELSEYTASVTLSGLIHAVVAFHAPAETGLRIFERMTGMEADNPTENIRDTMGEMANMIGGHGKRELEHLSLLLGLPRVVPGLDPELLLQRWPTHQWVTWETELGACAISLGHAAERGTVA